MTSKYIKAINGGGDFYDENKTIIQNAEKVIYKQEQIIENLKLELQEANQKLEEKIDKTYINRF